MAKKRKYVPPTELEEQFRPETAAPNQPFAPSQQMDRTDSLPFRGSEAAPPPLDLSEFGKEMSPFDAAEVAVMESTPDKGVEPPIDVTMGEPTIEPELDVKMGEPTMEDAPEGMRPEELNQYQPSPSQPPMVQAERPSVQEFIKSKLERPKFKDNSGWEAAQSAANAAIGFNPGKSVYALERERNEGQQKQFESDRNAEQQMIMQAITQKFQGGENKLNRDFQGGENKLNRGLERDKFTANLTSEEMRAIAAEEGRQERAKQAEEGRNSRLEQSEGGRNSRAEEANRIRQSEGAMGRNQSNANNERTNTTNERIFNTRQIDAGAKDLGKNVDAGLHEGLQAVDKSLNGPDGDHLLQGLTGLRGVAGDVPLVGGVALDQKQKEFKATYIQSVTDLRHKYFGASLTQNEQQLFDQALGKGVNSNPQTMRAAWRQLRAIADAKDRQARSAVRPESVGAVKARGGYTGPDEDEWEQVE